MRSDIVLFDSLSEWQTKVSELNYAFGYPNDRAERYADSPMVTADGKYALQVLPEAELYFQGFQLHNFDDLFQRQEGLP
jgi:hypothetical protein